MQKLGRRKKGVPGAVAWRWRWWCWRAWGCWSNVLLLLRFFPCFYFLWLSVRRLSLGFLPSLFWSFFVPCSLCYCPSLCSLFFFCSLFSLGKSPGSLWEKAPVPSVFFSLSVFFSPPSSPLLSWSSLSFIGFSRARIILIFPGRWSSCGDRIWDSVFWLDWDTNSPGIVGLLVVVSSTPQWLVMAEGSAH